jgi:hypothetical protein
MRILIDGHNLIGKITTLSLSAPDDEEQLVLMLRRYAARKRGRRIDVVFDCGTYGHPLQLNGYGVQCHFAKDPHDADEELIRRIRAIRNKDLWIVVSSDKRVIGQAKAHGINTMSSEGFAQKMLKQDPVPKVCATDKHKERVPTETEIVEWLRLFGAEDEL